MSNGYSYNIATYDIGLRLWYERMRFIVNELGRLQQEYERLKQLRDRIVATF